MKIHIEPTEDRVAVIPDPIEDMTAGGLHKVGSGVEMPLRGTIYAVGPGRYNEVGLVPMRLQKGDRVAFGIFSGQPVPVAGTAILIFREHDILCKLREEAEEGDELPAEKPGIVVMP